MVNVQKQPSGDTLREMRSRYGFSERPGLGILEMVDATYNQPKNEVHDGIAVQNPQDAPFSTLVVECLTEFHK